MLPMLLLLELCGLDPVTHRTKVNEEQTPGAALRLPAGLLQSVLLITIYREATETFSWQIFQNRPSNNQG